jgi:transketolase
VTNLCAIVDRNKGQIDGFVDDVMPLGDLRSKLAAFGWRVETIDGHDIGQIRRALAGARREKDRPTWIIADTIKGKGVSFMEKDVVGWHGKAPTKEELARALVELLPTSGGTA